MLFAPIYCTLIDSLKFNEMMHSVGKL